MSRIDTSSGMVGAGVLFLFDRLRCKGFSPEGPISGGAQRKSFQLAQHLARRGCRVWFASDDEPDSGPVRQLAANDITHVRVPFRSLGWLTVPVSLSRLASLVRRQRIRVIHSHDRWTAMFGRCAASLTGVDYFYTAHMTFCDLKATRAFFGRNVTAVSDAVRHNLLTYFGLEDGQIQVIRYGEFIAPATAEQCRSLRERYGLTANHRVVSSIGRLCLQKGHEFLLQALARLRESYPGLKCLLVGDGDQRTRLEQTARDLGLSDTVVFCGGQDHVAPFIAISEFTVLPSIAEGLGLTVVESCLLGVPVVATRVGGVPEALVEGVNGILVEPRDVDSLAAAMRWMLDNPDRARRMGSEGLESTKARFSLDAMLSAYENYYALRLCTDGRR